MAQAGIEQGVLAAKDLETNVPGAANEFRGLGDIAAGVLHAHDVGHGAGKLLHLVHNLAAAVVAVAGVALGVLVGEARAHGAHDLVRDEVLAGYQFNTFLLALVLQLDEVE